MLPSDFFVPRKNLVGSKNKLLSKSQSYSPSKPQSINASEILSGKSQLPIKYIKDSSSKNILNQSTSSEKPNFRTYINLTQQSGKLIYQSSISNTFLKRMKQRMTKRKSIQQQKKTRSEDFRQKEKRLQKSLEKREHKLTSIMQIINNQSQIKQKNKIEYKSFFKQQKQQQTLKLIIPQKQISSYLKFICTRAKYQTYQVYTGCNQLKIQDNRVSSQKYQQFKEELLFISGTLKTIMKQIKNSNLNSEQLIKGYCEIYFRDFNKVRLQALLLYHFFNPFQKKIGPLFSWMRLLLYIIWYFSSQRILINNQHFCNISAAINYLIDFFQKVGKITLQHYQQYNSLMILQGFKILRIVKDLDILYCKLSQQIYGINIHSYPQLVDIQLHFQQNLLDIYHITHLQQHILKIQSIISWKYLKIPPTPFLPPETSKKHTLVLGLQGVLIHFNNQSKIIKYRPFIDKFLTQMRRYFQIIIWSNSKKALADQIINQIENKQEFFEYRLYEQHFTLLKGVSVKNITRIGRNISRVIILECQGNFFSNQQNVILLTKYRGKKQDDSLLQAHKQLLKLQQNRYKDIKQYLKQPNRKKIEISEQKQQSHPI